MENILKELKFDDRGLIPVITQDYKTNEVLMMAYMNEEALKKSLETGKVHYFSRSRKQIVAKRGDFGSFSAH